MTTIRIKHRKQYAVIPATIINDVRLSFRARGVLVWLLDKPDNWESDSKRIAAQGTEGRDAVRAALNELVRCGYLVRDRTQDAATGHWSTEWTVLEGPVDNSTEDGIPGVGNPDVGKPGLLVSTDTQRKISRSKCKRCSFASGSGWRECDEHTEAVA